jgi:hypothetical protein
MARYFPNYMEKLKKIRQSGSLLLINSEGEVDQKSSPMIAWGYKCSREEDNIILQKNPMRPEIEEGVLIFKYLWKYRVHKARQEAFDDLQNRFWIKFLEDMMAYAT